MLRFECMRSCCGGGGAFLAGRSSACIGCGADCEADDVLGFAGNCSGGTIGGVVVGVVTFCCASSWIDGTDSGVGSGNGLEV